VDFDTHGLTWRAHLRANDLFVAMVTDSWHQGRLSQRQLAYARELGKPIVFLVQEGTALPPMREGEQAIPFASAEEAADVLARIITGDAP
jgi:hypothetical protein